MLVPCLREPEPMLLEYVSFYSQQHTERCKCFCKVDPSVGTSKTGGINN